MRLNSPKHLPLVVLHKQLVFLANIAAVCTHYSVGRWTQCIQLELSGARKKIMNKKYFNFSGMQTNELVATVITHVITALMEYSISDGIDQTAQAV